MQNLNINKNIFQNQKVKLQKRHVVPAALMVAATLLLTGCGEKDYYDYATINTNSSSATYAAGEVIIIDEYQDEIRDENPTKKVTDTIENDRFVFADSEFSKNFLTSLNNWQVNYTYSGIYNTATYLNKYENRATFSNEHSRMLEDVTVDNLYKKVVENNETYMYLKEISGSFCFYQEMPRGDIRAICEYIVEAYEDYSQREDVNIDEVKCILNNLKIFQNASAANAFVNNEYCLVTSPGMIEVLAMMHEGKDVNVYKNTIIHEATHLFQLSCPDRVNETTKMVGISPQYEEDQLNPLDFSWYCEASAEKCTATHTDCDPLVYESMISYLESVSIATILDSDVSVHQNEENCFTKDLNSIFKMFGCETEQEKIEIANMMYSIQIIQVEPSEFFESLGKDITAEEKAALKKDLRSSICSTLTKYFYKNMLREMTNKEVSLQDIFYLITIFENDINTHLSYNNIENFEYYEKFMQTYSEIQNEFFKTVSMTSGYTYEEVLDKFNNYALYTNANGTQEYNASLQWLPSEKTNYVIEREQALNTYSTASIQFVLNKRSKVDENIK